MRGRHLAAIAAALVLSLAAFVLALNTGSTHTTTTTTKLSVAAPAVAACNPAVGQGSMGICAPVTPTTGLPQVGFVHGKIGVDVSSYQGCPLHFSVSFVYIKATEGTGYTSSCLRSDVAAAKAQHKPYGTYDFLRPGSSSAQAEAMHYVQAVRAAHANTSMPPVADVEVNAGLTRQAIHAYVCTWHRIVRAQLHRSSITYTGNWFWGPQVGGGTCGSKLWVSAYASSPIVPSSWKTWTIWQYSDGVYGPGPHINRWDSDVIRSSATLNALAGQKPKPKPARRVTAAQLLECKHLRYDRRKHYLPTAHRRWRALKAQGILCTKHGARFR